MEQPRRKKAAPVQNEAKIEAVQQVGLLPDDDAVIIAFLKQTRFADARYAAAQRLKTVEAMVDVRNFTQKSDRRVYKLMQDRLNAAKQTEALLEKVQGVVQIVEALVARPGLAPNQVADVERQWAALADAHGAEIPDETKTRCQACLEKLGARLKAQIALQQELRKVSESLDGLARAGHTPDAVLEKLSAFESILATFKASEEVASLPKNALAALDGRISQMKADAQKTVEQAEHIQARTHWLENYEGKPVESLDRTVLEAEWSQLPQVAQSDYLPLVKRYNALREQVIACENQRRKAQKAEDEARREEERRQLLADTAQERESFCEHLQALKQAIGAGTVQEAQRHAEVLAQMHLDSRVMDKALLDECAQMQSELRKLTGWAKWSDKLSRENLIKAAEGLAAKKLSIDDLADAVMQLRAQWKELNAVTGMATREQWATFDAACNKAYEPVLVHARAQVDEKKKNVRYAEALIGDIKAFAERFKETYDDAMAANRPFDWKPAINFYRQTLQSWRQLGIVGRNEKKRLDAEMSEALSPVREKLYEQTQLEVKRREDLIAEVAAIDPAHPESGKKLRALQQKWQAVAKHFPLDNRKDSKLWSRFKEACGVLYDKRQEKGRLDDQAHRDNLALKEDICARLETLDPADGLEAFDDGFLTWTRRWEETGSVPQEAKAAVQKRFDQAVRRCTDILRRLRNEGLASSVSSGLVERLRLCSELENRILSYLPDSGSAGEDISDEDFDSQWKALAPLSDTRLETMLSNRFYKGLKAVAARNMAYGRRLQQNAADLADRLLNLEVACGLQVPPVVEDAAVQKGAVGQAAEKAQPVTCGEAAKELLETPAPVGEGEIHRICAILEKLTASA